MNVAVAGGELYCESRGRGPVCLVLCSSGTVPYQRQLPAALDRVFTLVFVDLRGSGRSTGAAGDLTFEVLAADLEAVPRQVGAACCSSRVPSLRSGPASGPASAASA